MRKYQITLFQHGVDVSCIRAVEVERETSKSVWIHGARESKKTGYCNYCDTWEEARKLLILDAKKHVVAARANLDARMKELEQLLQMNLQ